MRMRGNRPYLLFTTHLFITAGVLIIVYLFFQSSLTTASTLDERRLFGKVLFGLLIGMELVTICFISPALSAGMISSEREHLTYDLLRVTLISPRALVIGKYLSGLVFICLLLFTSLPLNGPAFLVGGILPEEILISVALLLVTAVAFCAVGVFFSCLFPRTLVSTILSYAFAITLVFGIPIILIVAGVSITNLSNPAFANLAAAQEKLLIYLLWAIASLVPLATMIVTEGFLLGQHNYWLVQVPLSNNTNLTMISPWMLYIGFYLVLSIILLWASIKLVNKLES
jgi:ABC-2 type transport system permease protein